MDLFDVKLEDYGNDTTKEDVVMVDEINNIRVLRENDSGEIRVFINNKHILVFNNCSDDFEVTIKKDRM